MMKVKINSKKGLKTSLSVLVDKKTIEKKLEGKLSELQSKANLKGFRPGKVPLTVIKNQFGKALYGEVVDSVLKETCAKAIEDNKIKVAGQPKIDLKTFGEGKDLNYTIELETLPNIKLKPLDKIKAIDYEISIEKDVVEKRINEIAKNQQNFSDKQESEKANFGDLVIFDYTAMVNGKNFEGNEGKGVQLVLGRDLFIKGFDNQLLGSKKNEVKSVEVKLPENYPKKELANKKANFNCKIINIKKPIKTKIDNDFAKKLGAKDINDLKNLIKKQITSEYQNSLNVITKKDILKQLESSHSVDLPQNLIEQETKIITQNLKKEDVEKHKDKNILIFGFTFMIWEYFYKRLIKEKIRLNLEGGIMLHGGGWKKLSKEAVDNKRFKSLLESVCGIKKVHNYYGMVEQTGSIFMECDTGHLHCSIFSEVMMVRETDFSECRMNETGLAKLLSLLPFSYPGHIILSEDIGEIIGEDDCPCGRLGKYFKIHGRIVNAEIRGCSDTYESI